jgi:hypothetical protein
LYDKILLCLNLKQTQNESDCYIVYLSIFTICSGKDNPSAWGVKNPGFKFKNCVPTLSFFHLRRRLPFGWGVKNPPVDTKNIHSKKLPLKKCGDRNPPPARRRIQPMPSGGGGWRRRLETAPGGAFKKAGRFYRQSRIVTVSRLRQARVDIF